MSPDTLLEITDLEVDFTLDRHAVPVIRGVNLAIPDGKTVCLVGESGCGKSVTAKSILRVLDRPGSIRSGSIRLRGRDGVVTDIAALEPNSRRLRNIRGDEVAMIHQEPMAFLSPLYSIGSQIVESLRLHRKLSRTEARAVAIDVLNQVGMPDPEQRFHRFTFELSGGQRQRAMIAMALVTAPRLLIADEPTTALDVTTQANILDLLKNLQQQRQMAMLFITHDLGVVAEIADEVAVMYLGQIVEQGAVGTVLNDPRHPYTQGLLAAMPRFDASYKAPLRAIRGMVPTPVDRPQGCSFHPRCDWAQSGLCERKEPPRTALVDGRSVACHAYGPDAAAFAERRNLPASVAPPASPDEAISAQTLVRVDGVSKRFPIRSGALSRTIGEVRAVSEVSFDIRVGETLGLVGESGCGKSTLGQTLVGLYRPNEGAVRFDFGVGGTIDPANAKGAQRRQLRTDVRMVFQDPTASLNPRLSVRDIIGEVLEINGTMRRAEIDQRVEELLAQVGLDADYAGRYPHAFSGGQRQRVAIARALAPRPRLVIADEAVSALDVSVQTQIINLMKELQRQYGLTYLFISHDLSVIANISDRVAVMYAGRMVEMGETSAIFLHPQHPYTETLLAAVPGRNRRRTAPRPGVDVPIEGPVERVGCSFAGRCPYVQERCRRERPELAIQAGPQSVACHRARELSLASPVTG